MKKMLNNLAKKLGMKSEELFKKLGVTEEANDQQICAALDVYKIFMTKENNQDYINKKLSNKELEIAELKPFKDKYSELQMENNLKQTRLDKIINSKWKSISDEPLDLKKLDYQTLDFDNIHKSLVNFADSNKIKVKDDNNNASNQYQNNFQAKTNTATIDGFVFRRGE